MNGTLEPRESKLIMYWTSDRRLMTTSIHGTESYPLWSLLSMFHLSRGVSTTKLFPVNVQSKVRRAVSPLTLGAAMT